VNQKRLINSYKNSRKRRMLLPETPEVNINHRTGERRRRKEDRGIRFTTANDFQDDLTSLIIRKKYARFNTDHFLKQIITRV